jgi:glycosyltransferase involved in cell wall biosynthesis
MKEISKESRKIKVFHKSDEKGPSGLDSVLLFGIKNVKGDVIIPFMGDLSDNPKDIIKLVKKLEEGYDVVCGSRFIKGGKAIGYPFLKLIAHRTYNKFFSFYFRFKFRGFFKCFQSL